PISALPVLRPGRADAPLRVPQVRPGTRADLHRRQDLRPRFRRPDPGAAVPERDPRPAGRRGDPLAAQDARAAGGTLSGHTDKGRPMAPFVVAALFRPLHPFPAAPARADAAAAWAPGAGSRRTRGAPAAGRAPRS